MRKMLVILFGFLVATLISMSTISPAQAAVEEFSWQPPYAYRGYESQFYSTYIVGYEDGATVNLKVLVQSDSSPNINVTSLSLVFDNGFNVTSDLQTSPVKIDYNQYHSFDVSFTADVTKLSNLRVHAYTIYVNYNDTGGPDTYYAYSSWDYPFVVFSASQVDAIELKREYDATSTSWYNFETAEAKSLARQASVEGSLAYNYLYQWDFANAKTHFQNALDLYNQTFEAEHERGSKLEDAQMNYYNAAVTQAYAWLLTGVGVILIGIGAIIYAVKKPKAT